MSKFYITTPIYYVNDKPHIGHAYSTIAADVLARYHRLKGDQVFFLTGTDEHGKKIQNAAEAAGLEPKEFCDQNAAKFSLLWDRLDISQDHFIRTTDDQHKRGVGHILDQLKAANAIYEGDYEGLYCVGCERFLTEKELVDGLCPDHKKAPEMIKEHNYFFNLKKYLPEIARLIDDNKIKIIPEARRNEVLGLFKQDISDFSISRENVQWGIPLPFAPDHTAYVWVDALSNYITALGYGTDNKLFDTFWPADVHILGKDILKFHALFWPAILLALGQELSRKIVVTGFFTVDGQKMSKSLGNVIDPHGLVDTFGADATRYLLLSQFPFGHDGDVKATSFAVQYTSDLANGVGNLVNRVLAMTDKYFAGQVPVAASTQQDQINTWWERYHQAMANQAIDQALGVIKEVNAFADGYIDQEKPWSLAKTNDPKLAEVLFNSLTLIRQLGIMIYPFMPETADKIGRVFDSEWQDHALEQLIQAPIVADAKLGQCDPLFPRLVEAAKE